MILTRRPGEALKIGDDIEICILGVTGNQVRIGTKAPQAVEVHRDEIYRRIRDEQNKSLIDE